MADNVLVIVIDLLWVGILDRAKGNETAGELRLLETVGVPNLGADFFEALQDLLYFYSFH
jgi:hypothetical protein